MAAAPSEQPDPGLIDLLSAASRGDHNALGQLEQSLETNYVNTLKQMALTLCSPTAPLATRHGASIYLKNALNGKSAAMQLEKHQRWRQVSDADRQIIKDRILQALLQPDVARLAASAASEVACVEVPFGTWPAFVQTVTVNNENLEIKIACIECLGFTMERIATVNEQLSEQHDVGGLSPYTMDQMLTTIVDAVQPARDAKLREKALQALDTSLPFCQTNMDTRPNERAVIVRSIVQAAEPSGKNNTAAIQGVALDCLATVAEMYYQQLPDHMKDIFNVTTAILQQPLGEDDDDMVHRKAIQFWSSLAQSEQELLSYEAELQAMQRPLTGRPPCPKYVFAAKEQLIPLLLQFLPNQDEDADENNVAEAAGICLEDVALTIEGAVLPPVIYYVEQHIAHANWRFREAAVVAFMCVLEGPSSVELAPYVTQSVPVLMQRMNDADSVLVRSSALFCIDKICRCHAAVLDPNLLLQVLGGVLPKLDEAATRVVRPACTVIFSIAGFVKDSGAGDDATNLMSQPMLPVLQKLLQVIDRHDVKGESVRSTALSAVSEMISVAAQDVRHVLVDLMPVMVDRFDSVSKMHVSSNEEQEDKQSMMGMLGGVMQVLFQKIDKEHLMPHADRIMQLLLEGMNAGNATSFEDLISAVAAVASKLEDDFAKYLHAFVPYLLQGMKSFEEKPLCMISIGCLVDVANAVRGKIQPFCDDIVRVMLECLRNTQVNREIKPGVISAMGDIAMAIGAAYEPYLQQSMMLLMGAAEQKVSADSEDLMLFIDDLRRSILEAFQGIVMGLGDGDVLHLFVPMLPHVLDFVKFLSTTESFTDEIVLKNMIGLLGDVAESFSSNPQVKQHLQQEYTAKVIQEGLQCDDESIRQNAEWARTRLQMALAQ